VFLQLWHSGRVSHPGLTGVTPVSASATESADILVFTNKGPVPAPRSRALEIEEITWDCKSLPRGRLKGEDRRI
jgi:N-ethylmaleimide reductase